MSSKSNNNGNNNRNNNKNHKGSKNNNNGVPEQRKSNKSGSKNKNSNVKFKYSFNDLPIDIMNAIIDAMLTPTFLQFRLVSKKWMRLCWKGRRTLDLTYIDPNHLPKPDQLKKFFEKAHGLRSLKTSLNMSGSEFISALDLENSCISLTSLSISEVIRGNEESLLQSAGPYLTRFVKLNLKHLFLNKDSVGLSRLTQLDSLTVGSVPCELYMPLTNLTSLVTSYGYFGPNWPMYIHSATKLEKISFIFRTDYAIDYALDALPSLRKLYLSDNSSPWKQIGASLNALVQKCTNLEVLKYPRRSPYHTNRADTRWDCHAAKFPPKIKKIMHLQSSTFAGLSSCLYLESLSVAAYPGNEQIAELHGLAQLKEFVVENIVLPPRPGDLTPLTDEAINSLKHATGLHTLIWGLSYGSLKDLPNINQFVHLRHLGLNAHNLSPQGISNIVHCSQLHSLALGYVAELTATLLKPLSRLRHLKCLLLWHVEGLNEKTTRQLDELTQLRDLRLTGCKNVTDQALLHMSAIITSSLQHLDVEETGVGPKGLQFVRHLRHKSKRERLWWLESLPVNAPAYYFHTQ